MIESWWAANELEVVLWGIALGLLAVGWIVVSLGEAFKERKQKRKDGLL